MSLEFKKIREFERGTLYRLLQDAYSFNEKCSRFWDSNWKDFDDFFYDNLEIADSCGFVTVLNTIPIGHISWDPRNMPDYVEIGHNCIAAAYKGNGYGKLQLTEAVRRIQTYSGIKKIIVTTNEFLIPAQRNYESVGFQFLKKRENSGNATFSGAYLDYEMRN
jgi:ribosomal protein S18 acetylase RimI-like enzyme